MLQTVLFLIEILNNCLQNRGKLIMLSTGLFVVEFAFLFFQRAAAEEICYGGSADISCSSSDEHIYVDSAIIGRLNNSKCYNLSNDEQECKANIRDQLQSQFLRKNQISISTIDERFIKLQPNCLGSLPPSFNITHQCIRGFWKASSEFCVGETVALGCLKEEPLIIESAFLGRHNNSRCYVRNENETSCNVDIKMALKDRFGNNNTISISMADPFIHNLTSGCSKSLPYSLQVSYQCSKDMPRNIRIESLKPIYNFGDRLECSADENPSSNFTWSCDNNGPTREGSVLTLDADTFHANVDYACQCTAKSSIFNGNTSETVIIRIAHGIRSAHETGSMIIIIIVLSSIFAAVIFAILMVLHFKGCLCHAANNDPGFVQHHEDHSIILEAVEMVGQDKNSETVVDKAEMINVTTSESTAEEKVPATTAASVAPVDRPTSLPAIKVQSAGEYSALCRANFPPKQPSYTKLEVYFTPYESCSPSMAPLYSEVGNVAS